MRATVVGLGEMDQSQLSLVGGKALHVGELSGIEGIRVPEGFCVTTAAYQTAIEHKESYQSMIRRLTLLKADDRVQIGAIAGEIRRLIGETEMPSDVAGAVALHLARLGAGHAYAVRSSATAEDLPHAAFAGQQDTYLNIIGEEAILQHISQCWASLFTDRAVIYRMRNGFDHSRVYAAVIVQRMVFPEVSGILFTADPLTSNRKVLSVDAGFGLGEALVSGMVSADCYKVRDGHIVDKRIAAKRLAVYGRPEGGTATKPLDPGKQTTQALEDRHILQLAHLGRRIEAYFGCPQDIEWCLADDTFYMLQSRPITTLYPIPETNDSDPHVYVSVGHQQMMTDPIRPLGLSFYLLTTPAPMRTAGGRLFVDVTRQMNAIVKMGHFDPLTKDALETLLERGDYNQPVPGEGQERSPGGSSEGRAFAHSQPPIDPDPAIVPELIRRTRASIDELRHTIRTKSGPELFDFILEDIGQLKKLLFDPLSSRVIMSAMDASAWINANMNEWLGENNAADTLSQSVPGNITSEMGLALLDVADVIRPYPEVVDFLQQVRDDGFLDEMIRLQGGREARDAICGFLDRYGMQCAGEIDLTRTRWSENPASLIPVLLANVKQFEPHAGTRKFEQGRQEAVSKEQALLERLKALPDGERKAEETKRRIDLIRHSSGYREYPKYGMVNRYFLYKLALLKEADRLVQAGVIEEREDIYYLTFEELREAVRTHTLDRRIIGKRKDEYAIFAKMTPPRVMTSDGEVLSGAYKRDHLPAGAIAGLPVSSGVVEGRARVLLHMEDADLEEGDILVTPFTDPGWTPLFVSIAGLVTEVGGLMTHGAVIAREYGLPAVVGVDDATTRIKDGQRIRVHGTEGYIELM